MKLWDIIKVFNLTPIIKTVSLCQVNIEQITFWDIGAWSLLVNGKQKGAIKSFFPRAFRHWKKIPRNEYSLFRPKPSFFCTAGSLKGEVKVNGFLVWESWETLCSFERVMVCS